MSQFNSHLTWRTFSLCLSTRYTAVVSVSVRQRGRTNPRCRITCLRFPTILRFLWVGVARCRMAGTRRWRLTFEGIRPWPFGCGSGTRLCLEETALLMSFVEPVCGCFGGVFWSPKTEVWRGRGCFEGRDGIGGGWVCVGSNGWDGGKFLDRRCRFVQSLVGRCRVQGTSCGGDVGRRRGTVCCIYRI